ncbi:uncharacterized protein LOC124416796 [Diprion similis]|uniref:uncharacterized protein LOC124416796 n=1 Tax=Diprion similis TaxID=362088 RepID=UPI001EF85C83|nr:uncharacterized protein LOC124416796 [Diprion similis]
MVKSLTTLFVLLIASSVQGGGIFGTSRSVFKSMSENWENLLKLVANTPITNQTCMEQSWDIEQLSSEIQLNSSVSCLTELKAAVESENPDDTALLEIIDKLIATFTEGATCACTEDMWDYVKCYAAIIEGAVKYMLSAWTTEASAAWELCKANSTIKSQAKSCVETIAETAAAANFKSAVQETVQCVKKWTS